MGRKYDEEKYQENKWGNSCVRCGVELEEGCLKNECELCRVKSRVSGIDTRLKRIEKFIDNFLTERSENGKKL